LDDVWKWIGFSQKSKAKTLLEKYFILDKDYKVLLSRMREQTESGRGGHNKETIMLTVRTFKLFCLHLFTFQTPIIYDNSAESRIIDI